MKNFISKIECVVEPSLYYPKGFQTVQITMRCRTDDKEWSITKIEDIDFMESHFDLIFNHMKENMKYKFLEEVNKDDRPVQNNEL
jgi:hypothetical protein